MKAACGALLLLLASCAAPRESTLSIADPEFRHRARLFGESLESEVGDPEAELRFQNALTKPPCAFLGGVVIDLGFIGTVEAELPPRKGDYGLYANPIP